MGSRASVVVARTTVIVGITGTFDPENIATSGDAIVDGITLLSGEDADPIVSTEYVEVTYAYRATSFVVDSV